MNSLMGFRAWPLLSVVLISLALTVATVSAGGPPAGPPGQDRATAAKNKHASNLLGKPGVVGVGVGVNRQGEASVVVLAESEKVGGLPTSLDGVPVVVKVTGRLVAAHCKGKHVERFPECETHQDGNGGGSEGGAVDIGTSTSRADECAAGTIGVRLTGGRALSNNHVWADENNASQGDPIAAPGLLDTTCTFDSTNNTLGDLLAWKNIVFSTAPGTNNEVDAAIVTVSAGKLNKSTPKKCYGIPKSIPVAAAVGQAGQKCGRTSGHTTGEVTVINADVHIGYSSGTALFKNQIIIQSNKKPVIKPGDSGSLWVTDSRDPVGLMFAANTSGKLAVASPIQVVLDSFKGIPGPPLAIDGE